MEKIWKPIKVSQNGKVSIVHIDTANLDIGGGGGDASSDIIVVNEIPTEKTKLAVELKEADKKQIYEKHEVDALFDNVYTKAEVYKLTQDVYTTEEKRIGTWIDGKPLYRITVVVNNPTESTSTDLSQYNIKEVVKLTGMGFSSDQQISLPYYLTSSGRAYPWYEPSAKRLNHRVVGSNKAYFIIEYTKTTD